MIHTSKVMEIRLKITRLYERMLKSRQFRHRLLPVLLLLFGLVFLSGNVENNEELMDPDLILNKSSEFKGFDNVIGADHFIVPNIIHFIRFNRTEYSFVDYLCLQAAFQNHDPKYFYIHTNVDNFTGKYWSWIQKDADLISRIRLVHLEPPSEIFGQKLNEEWRLFHGSDISRVRILMEYGGIYLDNDVFVINSLDKYRKYEISMNWDKYQYIGSQVIVAHKDARFLKLYLESYRNHYIPESWYYNAGERPTKAILYKHPYLLHRVQWMFGADLDISMKLYTDPDFNWRDLDAVHLLMGHRSYLDPGYNQFPEFDENNIYTYNNGPFGEMAREIMLEL